MRRLPHRDIGLFCARTPQEFASSASCDLPPAAISAAADRDPEPAKWNALARGRLTRDALEELVHDPATLCFICGPPALVSEMPAILQDLGIPRERIRIEEWKSTP
jgi:ferredoxin-NADP reductase